MTEQEKADIALIDYGGNENNMFVTLPLDRRTAAVCRRAIELSVYNFHHVPEAERTKELCLRVVRQWGAAFPLVPEPLITEKMCMAAVRNQGWALDYVPDKFRTPKICTAAVRNDPGALAYVPRYRLTEQLCLASVKKYGLMLQFVPERMRSRKMCRAALAGTVISDTGSSDIFRLIPYPDVCLEGLQRFGSQISDMFRTIEMIPSEALDERVALFGVRGDPMCLKLLPEHLQTEEVYREAVSRNGELLSFVPEPLRTARMCAIAVSASYHALQFVPDEHHSPRLYRQALAQDALAIGYFKPELLTREICNEALARADDLRVLRYIPFPDIHERVLAHCKSYTQTQHFLACINPAYMTTKLAEMIFTKEPELFHDIPERFKDRKLCETAVRYDGYYLQMVPEKFKTPELCREAIRRSPNAIPYIPESMKTPEFYRELVKENPRNLYGIPENDLTYDLCKMAFDNTYGRDKTDYSVAGALVDPSMTLQMVREQDDPRKIDFQITVMRPKAISEEVALEAVRKNGSILHLVPPNVITPQVAEVAVKNDPHSIKWVPHEIRTADMCLRAVIADPDLEIFVPDNIVRGDNIYSFRTQADDLIRRPLGYDDYKRLYAGEAAYLPDVQSPGGGMGPCRAYFDTQKRHFIVGQLDDPSQNKESRPARQLPDVAGKLSERPSKKRRLKP